MQHPALHDWARKRERIAACIGIFAATGRPATTGELAREVPYDRWELEGLLRVITMLGWVRADAGAWRLTAAGVQHIDHDTGMESSRMRDPGNVFPFLAD